MANILSIFWRLLGRCPECGGHIARISLSGKDIDIQCLNCNRSFLPGKPVKKINLKFLVIGSNIKVI